MDQRLWHFYKECARTEVSGVVSVESSGRDQGCGIDVLRGNKSGTIALFDAESPVHVQFHVQRRLKSQQTSQQKNCTEGKLSDPEAHGNRFRFGNVVRWISQYTLHHRPPEIVGDNEAEKYRRKRQDKHPFSVVLVLDLPPYLSTEYRITDVEAALYKVGMCQNDFIPLLGVRA